eukprot:gene23300-12467_t
MILRKIEKSKMLLHLYAFTFFSAPPPPPPLPITFDTAHPLRTNVSEKYLGVNIDAASMAAGMDFSNPSLRNLLKAMGPIKLRIGGTSSHGLVFTNAPSPSSCGPAVCASSCCGAKTYRDEVFLSTTCIDSIGDFLLATGAELLFNLPPTRLEPPSMSNNSAWNSTNSEELLEHIGKQPYAHLVTGVEVGNEQPTITSGKQLGLDLLLAQALAKKHGLDVQTVGPSLPKRAPPPGWVDEYCDATRGKLDLFAVHQYSGVDCK